MQRGESPFLRMEIRRTLRICEEDSLLTTLLENVDTYGTGERVLLQRDVSVGDREIGGEIGNLSIKKKSRKCLLPAPDRPQYCAVRRLVGDVLIVYADIPKVL